MSRVLEKELKEEVESYFPVEIISTIDFNVLSDNWPSIVEVPQEVSQYKFWHWFIDERYDDFDRCIEYVKKEIKLLEFVKPVDKFYWRTLPLVKDRNSKSQISMRFFLGFDRVN